MTTPVLDFTSRDWARWDTFDLNRYTYVQRSSHGLQDTPLTVQGATSSYPGTYFHMFRQEAINSFYGYGLQAFKWLQTAPGSVDDYLNNLKQTGAFAVQDIVNKVSFTLSQEYIKYRVTTMGNIRYTLKNQMLLAGPLPANATVLLDDASAQAFNKLQPDFRTIPAFQPIITWLTQLLTLHLDNQCMDPLFTVNRDDANDWRGATWRPYGTWKDHTTGKYDQAVLWWDSQDISFVYAHYIHLLDTALIRRIRRSAHAVLGAMWKIYQLDTMLKGTGNVADYQAIESQWMLRVGGWVGNGYVLQRSEDELRLRGVWGQAQADTLYEDSSATAIAFRVQNREFGQWSQAELLTQTDIFVGQVYQRFTTMGRTEFMGEYTLFHMNALSDWLLHCPASQRCYDMCSSMWLRIQWDQIVNFHPSSGSFPGPSNRSYDLFSGCHTSYDNLDQQLYYKHVFANASKPNSLIRVLTGKQEIRATLACDGKAFYLNPQYSELRQYYHRNMYAMAQLSGEGYLPYQLLADMSPSHINEQRYSLVPGQERYNFLTPYYAVGHSGEDTYLVATASFMVARISGSKAPPPAGPFVNAYGGLSPCSSYIKLMSETTGNPFIRPGGDPLGPAGDGIGKIVRSVVSQYQGFMLVTHLFSPTTSTTADEMTTAPWSSNLILPLAVDGLFLSDGTQLPMTSGTNLAIPDTQRTFTIRHGSGAIVVRLVSTDQSDISSVTWQVSPDSISCGAGRIVVNHRKQDSSTPVKPFKVVWLLGSGKFTSASELTALQALIQNAPVQQSLTTVSGVWDESNQPYLSYPAGSPAAPVNEVGGRRWTVSATVGNLRLGVDRTDVYLPWNNSPVYAQPGKGPLNIAPYYAKNVRRTVNDQDILQWGTGQDPYRTAIVQESDVFAPHCADGAKQVTFPTTWSYFG
jgi:hypothetical protein